MPNLASTTPRKAELLAASISYLLGHGVANLSLRPLAEAIGTSARLLIFHFKSKDGLLQDVLDEVQERLRASLAQIDTAQGRSPLLQFWSWATHARNLPYLRLLYEVHFIALQDPLTYASYLAQVSLDWVTIIKDRLPPAMRDDATATLCGAVFDGLVMELLTTGDKGRTTAALEEFGRMLSVRAAAAAERTSPVSTRRRASAGTRS